MTARQARQALHLGRQKAGKVRQLGSSSTDEQKSSHPADKGSHLEEEREADGGLVDLYDL